MSDLDLLLQYRAWRDQLYECLRYPQTDGLGWVVEEEFIDAFLDSWDSAYPPPSYVHTKEGTHR